MLYMCSTIKKAEALSVGPFGGLPLEDELDDEINNIDNRNKYYEPDDGNAVDSGKSQIGTSRPQAKPGISVSWEVTYSLSTKGEVSADKLF